MSEQSSSSETVVRRLVSRSAARMVHLDRLLTDASYQRGIQPIVKKIVDEFDEIALGVPLIGERENGDLFIVDGLQRVTALRKMGWKDVLAKVFKSHGAEHEALIFKFVNVYRKKVSTRDQFKAMLVAQDVDALLIQKIATGAGYKLEIRGGKHRRAEANSLECFATLLNSLEKQGEAALRFSLEAIRDGWPGDPMGTSSYFVGGIAIWYKRHDGAVDRDRLIARMQATAPGKVLYEATQMSITENKFHSVATVMERLYNKRLRTRKPS